MKAVEAEAEEAEAAEAAACGAVPVRTCDAAVQTCRREAAVQTEPPPTEDCCVTSRRVPVMVMPTPFGTDDAQALGGSSGSGGGGGGEGNGSSHPTATVHARTVFGVLRALETFAQLTLDGGLIHAVRISDWPEYRWRGVMVDTGRRFWPVATLHWLMDGMQANKLNLVHLHLSDFCRFAIESKAFPHLTTNLTGLHAGFYTQEEVRGIVQYALERGIRVVPELDLPGHARGLLSLEQDGLEFCEPSSSTRSQLFDDSENKSFTVLATLLHELAELFPDSVLNVGSDETRVKGRCTLANTRGLEAKVLSYIEGTLGKQPMAWVNALTTTHAATPSTILDTWATVYGMPEAVTAAGFQCVASTYMYLNHVDGPVGGISNWWRDIAPGVSEVNKHLMLGGETSMWSDSYCWTHQCGSSTGPTPVAAQMYGPHMDREFAASIAGVMFPRTAVGAGSFWNFQPGLDAKSSAFSAVVRAQNERMAARGLDSCPEGCACETLTRCGKPYIRNPMD